MHKLVSRLLTAAGALFAAAAMVPHSARAASLLDLCEEVLAEKRSPELSADAFTRSFAGVQAYWKGEYAARGWPFEEAKIVVFTHEVETACGPYNTLTGPIFCAGDSTIYVSPGYFDGSEAYLGTPTAGFREYVIAHEYGHHLQRLRDERLFESIFADAMAGDAASGALVKKMELQADCLAGVFLGVRGKAGVLGVPDLVHVLKVAAQIGNDLPPNPLENFEIPSGAALEHKAYDHGSGGERALWVQKGITGMSMEACEPFSESIFGGPPAPQP